MISKSVSTGSIWVEVPRRIIPFIPHTYNDLTNCMAIAKCDEFRKNYFVHVSLLIYYYLELFVVRVVHIASKSTHVRSLLPELQARALCDGEAIEFFAKVR